MGLMAEEKQKRTARGADAQAKGFKTMSYLLQYQARTAAGCGQYGTDPARKAVKLAVEKNT